MLALNVPLVTLAVTVRLSSPVPVTVMLLPTTLGVFSPTEKGSSAGAVSFTVGAASNSPYPCIAAALSAKPASMLPVVASSSQLPPWSAEPVGSVDAAMSAPVRRASSVIKARPSLPAATSQPYNRISALSLRCVAQPCNWLACCAKEALLTVSLPSVKLPGVPWLMICTELTPLRPCRASVMAARPDSWASTTRTTTLLGKSASRLV